MTFARPPALIPKSKVKLACDGRSYRGARVCDPQHSSQSAGEGFSPSLRGGEPLRVTDPRSVGKASAESASISQFGLMSFFRFSGLLLAAAFAVGSVAAETAKVNLPRINYTAIDPGLGYAHICDTNLPWSIHIARLDRRQRGFEVVTTLARGKIQGLATLSQQVAALPAESGRPRVAVNGDFFLIKPGPYQGDPEGLQILASELVSAPKGQCFWAEADGKLHIGAVASRLAVLWPDGHPTPFALNQTPPSDGTVLFTPTFGDTTEATNATELVLEKAASQAWLPLRVDETYRARVREVRPTGNTALTRETMVLTVTGNTTTNLTALKSGDFVTLTTSTSAALSKATIAVGGGPVLVHDGKEQPWPSRRGPLEYKQPRHPRTAIGFNRRYLYLVAVDGRQTGLSVGMSFVELASLLKQIGCTEALNLDGGGSTMFWLDGKVMNSPSDKHERAIANALVIVQKTK